METMASNTNESPPQPQLVRFLHFRSIAEPSFWLDHNARKLNELRLSEDGVPIHGYFGVTTTTTTTATSSASDSEAAASIIPTLAPGMRFDASSSSASSLPKSDNDDNHHIIRRNEWIRSSGKIYSLNTIESLRKCDKNKFLNDACLPSLLACCGIKTNDNGDGDDAADGDASKEIRDESEDDPNAALVASICLTYCDLKSNMTVYWFAFPALSPRSGSGIAYSTTISAGESNEGKNQQRRLIDEFGPKGCRMLSTSFHKFRVSQERDGSNTNVWCPPFFLLLPPSKDDDAKRTMKCLALTEKTYNSLTKEEKEQVIFGFVDPNPSPSCSDTSTSMLAVGWTLRNLVAYLSLRLKLGGSNVTFLSYRPPFLRRIMDESCDDCANDFEDVGEDYGTGDGGIGQSLLLDIKIPLAADYQWPSTTKTAMDKASAATKMYSSYKCVGWELNKNNKAGPRSIDLRPLVSPSHLARQANDLNLRLMKWRALPSLDVERLSQLKVLLLGAGTLGCGVARTLLGWGVRNITFVDSGRVSYSNPVRQSLFGIDDCKDGGKHKAVAAAESLVAIAGPDVKSEGVVLTIPMPGHSFGGGKDGVAETAAVKKDVEQLHKLIDEHDAVFLLTDTRESRWLPTVMALATNTPLINAALGLDTWLVMRHGPSASSLSNVTTTNNQKLGCYFCNDIVAPENSTRDRTLDQQCTVTRPGLAPIAASMATELMVAIFHHQLNHCAPAPEASRNGSGSGAYAPADDGTCASSTALGLLPHQIRGTVVTYTMMTPTVPAFPSCTACSEHVIKEYQKGGFDFVKCVCNDVDGSYLESVSGLAGFREEAARKIDDCLDWDDDEEE